MPACRDRIRTTLHNLNPAIEGLEAQQRSGAEKTVAADPLAAHNALEQKRPITLLDLAKSGDRRERVSCELTVHGHQARMAGQLDKFFEARKVTHGLSP